MKSKYVNANAGVKCGGLILLLGILMLSVAVVDVDAADEGRISVPAFPDLVFRSQNILSLPPGEVRGTALRSDQRTPYDNIDVALLDDETGEDVVSAMTDEDGGFVFEDVPEGRYVVRIGNPGIISIVDIVEGADPGTLDFAVPAPATLPAPGWAPGWAMQTPVLGAVVAGGAVVGAISYWRHRRERDRELSPIMP